MTDESVGRNRSTAGAAVSGRTERRRRIDGDGAGDLATRARGADEVET